MKVIQSVMGLVLVWLCSVICLVNVTADHLDLSEGDTCKDVNGTRWVCKSVKDCQKANRIQQQWEAAQYQLCNPKGGEVIVCCEPAHTTSAVGVKAKEMCKKYGEAVFVKIPHYLPTETFLTHDTCYKYIEPLIVGSGGTDAGEREFPHMALIGYGDASSINWLCGGSLISERFVLSAAHCSVSGRGRARWVRLGDYNFQSTEDEKRGVSKSVEYEITEIINHPNYTSSRYYNDIALYKLNTTVEFDEFIRPLCLHTDYDIPNGRYTATGWGITKWGGKQSDILQVMEVLVNSSNECKESYKTPLGNKLQDGIKDESMLCAGDVYKGVDTCLGDSGGPLQVPHPEVYCMFLQFGITSFGSICAGNHPGVYTRVSYFISWIESVVWQ